MQNILLIGIGNSLRADDGVGEYVCAILKNKYPSINTIIMHQLDVAIMDDISQFGSVIFIDASIQTTYVTFNQIKEDISGSSFSHYINANIIAGLNRKLYQTNTAFYLCSIGASDFNFSIHFRNTQKNALHAIELLSEWIEKQTNSVQ